VETRHEEVERLLYFVGALAQAGPLAVAYAVGEEKSDPDCLSDFVALAEELTKEARQRLALLATAGEIWQDRAEGKEG